MKIKNSTHWETKHIRKFVSEALKRSPQHLKQKYIQHKYRRELEVTVVYNKQRHRGSCSGRAWCNTWSIKLMLPSQVVDRVDLVHVIAHELAHTLGYSHADMTGNALFNRTGNWREIYAWADTLPLEKTQAKAKPKGTDLQLVRYNRVVASMDRWSTKLKRAQTALKKLNQQKRYYEKRLAAKGVR